jgi:ATP-dependent DNA ligase
MSIQEWTFKSSSSPATYTARLADDGKLLCNCKGWTMRRGDKARQCKHTKEVAIRMGANVIERGEFAFVSVAVTGRPAKKSVDAPADRLKGDGADRISPMLATAMIDVVAGKEFDRRYPASAWAMEQKLDGHRCIAVVTGGVVDAYSRPRAGELAKTTDLPDRVIEQLQRFPDGIYDGEKVAATGKSWDVTSTGATLVFVIFDILSYCGQDQTGYAYELRRDLLLDVLRTMPKGQTAISTVESLPPSWAGVEAIWKRGGEGVIVKRRDSRYQPGYRSADWIKVKKILAAKLTITGFTAGKSGPYSTLNLRDAAGIETTVKTLDNALLREIAAAPKSFIGRAVVISYQEQTPSGSYRHPRFDHFAEVAPNGKRKS